MSPSTSRNPLPNVDGARIWTLADKQYLSRILHSRFDCSGLELTTSIEISSFGRNSHSSRGDTTTPRAAKSMLCWIPCGNNNESVCVRTKRDREPSEEIPGATTFLVIGSSPFDIHSVEKVSMSPSLTMGLMLGRMLTSSTKATICTGTMSCPQFSNNLISHTSNPLFPRLQSLPAVSC